MAHMRLIHCQPQRDQSECIISTLSPFNGKEYLILSLPYLLRQEGWQWNETWMGTDWFLCYFVQSAIPLSKRVFNKED